MRGYLLGALIGAGGIISTAAATHEIPEDEPVARIDLPEKWHSESHDEFVEATSPNGSVHVLVTMVEGHKVTESMGEVMRYVRGKGGINFTTESLNRASITIRGQELKTVSWEGKDQEGPVKITYIVVPMTGHPPLLFVYWGAQQEEQRQEAAIRKMLESIKKT